MTLTPGVSSEQLISIYLTLGISCTLCRYSSLERKKGSLSIHVRILPPLVQISSQGGFDEKSTGEQLTTILDISALGLWGG